MSKKYHYTYRITNTKERMYYYGVHSCDCLPKEDIGVKYWSSSKREGFIKDQKQNPENYKYKVIKIFGTRIEAVEHEIFLHNKFNVGLHKKFYNDSKQGSTNRDTSGRCPVRDKDGNTFLVNTDDPRFLSGELVSTSKGLTRIITTEHRANLSKALTGKKKSPEHCLAVSLGTDNKGKNHPRFKGYYITPLGKFDSPAALIPIISLSQIKNYCNFPNRIISKSTYNQSRFLQLFYTYDEIKDRTYGELGFSRELKDTKELKEPKEPKELKDN